MDGGDGRSRDAPPVIDAQGFLAAPQGTADPPQALCEAISAACSTHGFFQMVNHGLDLALLSEVQAAMGAFFALPPAAKRAVARSASNPLGFFDSERTKQIVDLKEGWDVGHCPGGPDDGQSATPLDGVNRWPGEAVLPGFEASIRRYMGEMSRCSFLLLRAFCRGLGLPADTLHPLFEDRHTSFLRLNYYPLAHPAASAPAPAATAAPAASLLGINPHTDAGFLTILAQDAVPGLEVEAAGGGGWVLVDPIPGALTVNVGDQCQVISNGRFRAPPHRVRGPLPGAAAPRYSAAFFFNPRPDAEVAPLPCFVDAAHPPAYRPIRWGEFRAKRFAGDYADLGEEVQISHYRI